MGFDYIIVGFGVGGGLFVVCLVEVGKCVLLFEVGSVFEEEFEDFKEIIVVFFLYGVLMEYDELSWWFFVDYYEDLFVG